MVDVAIKMRRFVTESGFGLQEIRRIYLNTPVSDYFKQDASLGGYVPHKRKLRKKLQFK